MAWATGVSGYPQSHSPMGPVDLVALAAELGVPMVQIRDNMPLTDSTADDLLALVGRAADGNPTVTLERMWLETGVAHLRDLIGL